VNVEEWWLCGCGFTATELQEDADCRCGLNPLARYTWIRARVGDRSCWRFVRSLGERALTLSVLGWNGGATEALGLFVGDLGSICSRWTVEILVPTMATDSADAWHQGRPYRYLQRGDELVVPWLAALMLGRPVHCVDAAIGMLMIVDAFVFVGCDFSQRVTFLVGRPFSVGGGEA